MLQETKARAKKPATKQQSKTAKNTKQGMKKSDKSRSSASSLGITPEQRQSMIQVAAYYIAEREGFTRHSPLEYWLTAEAEIDRQLLQQVAK